MTRVKAARDGNAVPHHYGEIEGISRAWGKILPGVKNKLQQEGLVEGGIINHNPKFSTLLGRRKGSPSIFTALTILLSTIKL
jgi:hypothetical protein